MMTDQNSPRSSSQRTGKGRDAARSCTAIPFSWRRSTTKSTASPQNRTAQLPPESTGVPFPNGTEKCENIPGSYEIRNEADKKLAYTLHYTIKKVTEDIRDRFNFNTAISAVMELVNELYKYKEGDINDALYSTVIKTMIVLLAPFVPHITEELWQELGYEGTVYEQSWPTYDEEALKKDEIEIVVQINGKNKEKINIPGDATREDMLQIADENEKIKGLTDGKNVVKVIAVPGRLINIVVKG